MDKNFDRIGSLTTIKDPDWGLKINIEEEKKIRYEQAVELYTKIKNDPNFYEGLFNGDTKLYPVEVI